LFGVDGGVRAEEEFTEVAFFHFDDETFVFGAETFVDDGVEDDFELEVGLIAVTFFEDFAEFTLDFDAHGEGAFDFAAAFAVGAIVIDGGADAFGVALACHFHEAELGDGEDMGFGAVAAETFFHAEIDGLLIAARFHIDEIEDDEAAHVTEAKLTADFVGGLDIDFSDDGFLFFGGAFMAAGIDVDGDEGFGFVDDDIAAGFEVDLAREGGFELARDIEAIEDGLGFGVEFDFIDGAFGDTADHIADAVMFGVAVDDDAFDVFGEEIADGAFDEVGFAEDAGGIGLFGDAFLDFAPFFEEESEVTDEVTFLLIFADGADDDAHAIGDGEFAEDFFEADTFFVVLDFAGDAALVGVREEDEVTAGESEVSGDAGSFIADGSFGDLDDDIAAWRVEAWDIALGDAGFIASVLAAIDEFDAAIEAIGDDIPVMEEGIFFEADIDEGGFEAVLEVFDAAFEDATDEAFVAGAFDGELFESAVFEDGDADFEGFGVDDDLFVDFFRRLDEALDAADDFIGDAFDGIDEALWGGIDDGNGMEGGIFFDLGGDGEVGLAEVFARGSGGLWGLLRGCIFGEAGGAVFGAFDFADMARGIEDDFLDGFIGCGFGAGQGGVGAGFRGADAAGGAEAVGLTAAT
jgi:hypothetical protein